MEIKEIMALWRTFLEARKFPKGFKIFKSYLKINYTNNILLHNEDSYICFCDFAAYWLT